MSEPDTPTIAVAVCTKGRHRECLACLESVHRQTRPAAEVIVVEAGDDDRLHDAIRERWPAGQETKLIYVRVAEAGLTRQRNTLPGLRM